jgi:fumarylacetoacetase
MTIDETHDPARKSWVGTAGDHPDFPVQNLPFGIFAPLGDGATPRAGVAIGDFILDLRETAARGLLDAAPLAASALAGGQLNGLLALPLPERQALRRALSRMLTEKAMAAVLRPLLHLAASCRMHVPATIGDYTDFYAGIHHATAVGKLFRPDAPLLPNYKHVPIGYHGRASSVRVSGGSVRRPFGQIKVAGAEAPVFQPTQRLDYELELGIWVGEGNLPGSQIPIGEAERHIAGFCLLNDWSARDIQAWEYQPLGPFLAKSFHTTISPWIVTAEALAPFRLPQPARPAADPAPLGYLRDDADQARGALGIRLTIALRTVRMREAGLPAFTLCNGTTQDLYWTPAQLLTHHASNGCDMRPGDLLGTGTISGPDDTAPGSLLEATQSGRQPLQLPNGESRTFLEDGDQVLFSATAVREGYVSIGFGPCSGEIAP